MAEVSAPAGDGTGRPPRRGAGRLLLTQRQRLVGPPVPRHLRRRPRKRRPRGPWALLVLIFVGVLLAGAVAGLSGKPIRLPVWAVAEAEERLNAALARAVAGRDPGRGVATVTLGGAVVQLDPGWVPRLVLEDLRLTQAGGETLLVLPEARLAFDGPAALRGELRPTALRLTGAHVVLRRLSDGRFDISLGGPAPTLAFDTPGELLDAADAVFAQPVLSALAGVDADALTLTIEDRVAGRVWDMGDGRLRLAARPEGLAAEIGLSLIGGGAAGARADLTVMTERAGQGARIGLGVDRVAAGDLAALAAPLAWLGLVEAPISGRIDMDLGPDGRFGALTARLDLGAGVLRPGAEAAPVEFGHAALAFAFDPARERLVLTEAAVESPALRLKATGHADLPGARQGRLDTLTAQIAFAGVQVDPEGVFAHPVTFGDGALDVRLRLKPFAMDVGQLVLRDGDRRLSARGRVAAEPGGWRVAFDTSLNSIDHAGLLALWPQRLVPRTRDWLAANLQEGELFNVRSAVRLAPEAEPVLSLTYDFTGAGVRFMRSLPPIRDGAGYATLEGTRYTVVVDRGWVDAPEGGTVDAEGSVFAIRDITEKPAQAVIDLRTTGSLTATLSLLDQPPFLFLTKAGRPVGLGEGQARLETRIEMPLIPKVPPSLVAWRSQGTVTGLRSDLLVPGRRLEADSLAVEAAPKLLTVSGRGTLEGVPFDAVWRQPLGPEAGPAGVEGTIGISAQAAERLVPGLPAGLVGGQGEGRFIVTLARGEPPVLRLTSDLRGVAMAIPQIGWSKARGSAGSLAVTARLTAPAAVERVELAAPGLDAAGRVGLRPGGGLDRAEFDRVQAGNWFEGKVALVGRGGGSPDVVIGGGTMDLRRMPAGLSGSGGGRGGAGAGAGTALSVTLDRLRVTETIALTALRGDFSTRGGFGGRFQARVNGRAPVAGTVVTETGGTAVRLTSADAGGVLAAAGLFPNARGGELTLVLRPRAGGHDGRAEMTDVRVQDAPVLAALLNAASIVGLLEQLNGSGLLFAEADTDFRLTQGGVEIIRGAAVGASMGVSMAGVYDAASGRLDLQGVVSPFYLVNGIGAVLTRRGEGLFGMTYRVTGPTAGPTVSVNPLSILTPGMFREIFRRPPPRIRETG